MHITSGVMDMTKLKRGKYGTKKDNIFKTQSKHVMTHGVGSRSLMYQPTVGVDLLVVGPDQNIRTEPEESKRRRTIILRKDNDSWGFTVHTYGIHHKTRKQLEILTYVDYVSPGGPAFVAGMRAGDVILAINGISMETADHNSLVNFIKTCETTMRMIVLFEDCCHKVELHSRYIKLRTVLRAKLFEIRSLEHQEALILEGKSRLDPRRLSLVSSSSSSVTGFWDDRLSLRPEYDICPLHATSPILPKHNSNDTSSPCMASTSSASLCSCEFNVSFTPDGRLQSRDALRSSFGCHSLGSDRRHPQSALYLRNTSSLDRADFNRQKRPKSLNLSRPISSYDLKFPAIEELELKTCNSSSAVPSVSERVQEKSRLSRSLVYSSCRSDSESMRKHKGMSPWASANTTQRNNGEIHRRSINFGKTFEPVISTQNTSHVVKSHKTPFRNNTVDGIIGSSFTRSFIYHSSSHRLRNSSKLKRSLSHRSSEVKGSPMLLSIKPLTPDLPLSPPGGGTISCTTSNSLRYSRNMSGENNSEDEFMSTDSPLVDSVFPSPSHLLPGPIASTPVLRSQVPSTDARKPFTCNLGKLTSSSATSSTRCNVPQCQLCDGVDAITLRRNPQEDTTIRPSTSDGFGMMPSVTVDTDNWYLVGEGECGDSCGDTCYYGYDCLINTYQQHKQQKHFVFYSDLSHVQLEFVSEKDEETAL